MSIQNIYSFLDKAHDLNLHVSILTGILNNPAYTLHQKIVNARASAYQIRSRLNELYVLYSIGELIENSPLSDFNKRNTLKTIRNIQDRANTLIDNPYSYDDNYLAAQIQYLIGDLEFLTGYLNDAARNDIEQYVFGQQQYQRPDPYNQPVEQPQLQISQQQRQVPPTPQEYQASLPPQQEHTIPPRPPRSTRYITLTDPVPQLPPPGQFLPISLISPRVGVQNKKSSGFIGALLLILGIAITLYWWRRELPNTKVVGLPVSTNT